MRSVQNEFLQKNISTKIKSLLYSKKKSVNRFSAAKVEENKNKQSYQVC